MEQSLYPAPSKDISQKRKDLCAGNLCRLPIVQPARFCRWRVAFQNEGAHCGRRGACDPVPLLHPQPHQTRDLEGSDGTRDHGGDLGCCRDASGRCLRTFGDCHRRNESEDNEAWRRLESDDRRHFCGFKLQSIVRVA
jgi:hypothetical protein